MFGLHLLFGALTTLLFVALFQEVVTARIFVLYIFIQFGYFLRSTDQVAILMDRSPALVWLVNHPVARRARIVRRTPALYVGMLRRDYRICHARVDKVGKDAT